MKLSFSTSACPEYSFDKTLLTAKKLRFDGIELSCVGNESYLPSTAEFSAENTIKTAALIKDCGIEIPVISTHTVVSDTKNRIGLIHEPYEYIDIACKIGTPYVRVLADKSIEPSIDESLDLHAMMDNLKKICSYAKPKEITILVETNGFFSDSRLLARLLSESGEKNVGILWDVNHTVRFSAEPPQQTVAVFGSKIKHVHLKDTVMKNGNLEYRAMGRGDLPINEAVSALKKISYDGYLSLDWPRKTVPALLPPETILPQFLYYIKNFTE